MTSLRAAYAARQEAVKSWRNELRAVSSSENDYVIGQISD
jgi:hypothetical protein